MAGDTGLRPRKEYILSTGYLPEKHNSVLLCIRQILEAEPWTRVPEPDVYWSELRHSYHISYMAFYRMGHEKVARLPFARVLVIFSLWHL
jgi:hypothetical protein